MFYEDFIEGSQFRSGARTVTADDIRTFSHLSGDRNAIHLEEAAARAAGFDTVIAHGALGLALATGLASGLELTQGSLIALAGISWRFRAPVYPGDAIALTLTVKGKRGTRSADRGLVTLAAELVNQRGDVVQEGEFVELVRRRT